MASALLFAAIVAVCGLMLWASTKLEPHWVSKDRERMICFGQAMTRAGVPQGRWREVRVTRMPGDVLDVRPRRGTLAVDRPTGLMGAAGMRRRPMRGTTWRVNGRTETALKRRVLYILDGNDDPALPDMIALRLPTNSKAIPMLEDLAVNKAPLPTADQDRGTESKN